MPLENRPLKMTKPELQLLYLDGMPIEEQLYLEEALLRIGQGSWCLINRGAPQAIVMGVSGKAEAWIDLSALAANPIPVIQRYSGGGTVVIGPDTLLVSFIMSQESLPHVAPYPESLLKWSSSLYEPLFAASPHPFARIEQDYTLGGKKCGGNAQYLAKGRWVHHTSWLWNYTPAQMGYLLSPPKQPTYRQGRGHLDFLTPLCHHFPCATSWINQLSLLLHETFTVEQRGIEGVEEVKILATQAHRRTTRRLV